MMNGGNELFQMVIFVGTYFGLIVQSLIQLITKNSKNTHVVSFNALKLIFLICQVMFVFQTLKYFLLKS